MKALRPALQDKKFSPAYYLLGEDEFLKEEALRKLIDAAVDPATRDFNLDQRRGAELDAASLASLVGMPPMMAERRIVVIRDVGALRKDARAALEKYLRSPAPDILVIVTAPADAKADKALSALSVSIDCEPLTGAQIPKWIVARVEKHLGMTITPAAVELLQDAVGADLSQLAIELEKLASYSGNRPIDEDAVSNVVGVRPDETSGRLLDAVAMRDSVLALALIPAVLQQPKMGAVPLVMALTTQTLALAIGKARGIPVPRQAGEYFSLLRTASSNLTGRAWGEAVSSWARASGKWTTPDLDHALDILLQTDLALKTSRVSSDEQILATAILGICGGVSYRNAA
jgi:DNA polymerase III subunit delta